MSWWLEGITSGLGAAIGFWVAILLLRYVFLPVLNRIYTWVERIL